MTKLPAAGSRAHIDMFQRLGHRHLLGSVILLTAEGTLPFSRCGSHEMGISLKAQSWGLESFLEALRSGLVGLKPDPP